MDYSVEERLFSRLITELTGFRPQTENHEISLNFMVENAVVNHSYPSTFSANVQRELMQLYEKLSFHNRSARAQLIQGKVHQLLTESSISLQTSVLPWQIISCLLSLARRPHDAEDDPYMLPSSQHGDSLSKEEDLNCLESASDDSALLEWMADAADDTSDASDDTASAGQLTPTSENSSPTPDQPHVTSIPPRLPPTIPRAPPLKRWSLPQSRTVSATHLVHAITGLHKIEKFVQLVTWGSRHRVEVLGGPSTEHGPLVPQALSLAAHQLQRWAHSVQFKAARIVSQLPSCPFVAPSAAELQSIAPECHLDDAIADTCSLWHLLRHLPYCSTKNASATGIWAEEVRRNVQCIDAALQQGAPVFWGLAGLPASGLHRTLQTAQRTLNGDVLSVEGASAVWQAAAASQEDSLCPWLRETASRVCALLDALHGASTTEAARAVHGAVAPVDLDSALAALDAEIGGAWPHREPSRQLQPPADRHEAGACMGQHTHPVMQSYLEAIQPTLRAVDVWMRKGDVGPGVEETWLHAPIAQFEASQKRRSTSTTATGSQDSQMLPWPARDGTLESDIPIVFSGNAQAILRCGFMVRALVGGTTSSTDSAGPAEGGLAAWANPDHVSQRQLADEIASVQCMQTALQQRLASLAPPAPKASPPSTTPAAPSTKPVIPPPSTHLTAAMSHENNDTNEGCAPAALPGSFLSAFKSFSGSQQLGTAPASAAAPTADAPLAPGHAATEVGESAWARPAMEDLESFVMGVQLSQEQARQGGVAAASWGGHTLSLCLAAQAADGGSPERLLVRCLQQVTAAHCSFIERHMLTVLLFDVDLFRYLRLTRALAFGLHGQLHAMAHQRIIRSCAAALEQSSVHAVKEKAEPRAVSIALTGVATAQRLTAGASPLRWLSAGDAATTELDDALLEFKSMGPHDSTTNEVIHNIASGKMVTVLEGLPHLVQLCGFQQDEQSTQAPPAWGVAPPQAHQGVTSPGSADGSVLSAAPVVEINARAAGRGGAEDSKGGRRRRPTALVHGARHAALARRSAATKLRSVVHSGGSTVAGGSTLSDAASVALSSVLGSAVSGWSSASGISSAVAGTLARRKHDMLGRQQEQVATADVVLRRVQRFNDTTTPPPYWAVPPLKDCFAPGVTAVDIRRQVLWFAQELSLHGEALKQFSRGDVLTGTFRLHFKCVDTLAQHAKQSTPRHPTSTAADVMQVLTGVQLDITPPWPLSLVFSPSIVRCCAKLHSTVLQLAAAADLNGHAQQLMRRAAASMEYYPELRRVACMSQAVAHTLQALRNFVCSRLAEGAGHGTVAFDAAGAAIEGEVSLDGVVNVSHALSKRGVPAAQVLQSPLLSRSAAVVGRSVASADSVEDVVALFNAHFEQLTRSCLLQGVEGPVLAAVQQCINVCVRAAVEHARMAFGVQFAAAHHPNQCRRQLLQGYEHMLPLFEQLRRVQGRLHRRCSVLHKLAADGAGVQALQGTAASALVQLMDSIDSNGFLAAM